MCMMSGKEVLYPTVSMKQELAKAIVALSMSIYFCQRPEFNKLHPLLKLQINKRIHRSIPD